MSYKGLMFVALLFVCAVRAERFALLTDLLARYDPYTGKIREPVHLNYGVDTSIKFKGIVIPKHCNVYEGPAVSHKVVGVLSQFDKVMVIGEVVFTESGEEARHAWYQLGDKQFVMEHYIFNRNKANVEGSESSEDYSDVKKDFNHVEGEKPKIEEIEENEELPGTTQKDSMEDMTAKDTTESIINSSQSTDGGNNNEEDTTQTTDGGNNNEEDTTQTTDGGNSDENASQTTDGGNNNEEDTTQTTDGGNNNEEDTTQTTDGGNNNEEDTTQTTDGGNSDENASQVTDGGNNNEEDTTQTTDGDNTATTNSEAPADTAGAGDIYDEEADG